MIGISVYPYAFFDHNNKCDPSNLPAKWMSQIHDLAPGSDDIGRIWRDTGFYDESLNARSAFTQWKKWLALPHEK